MLLPTLTTPLLEAAAPVNDMLLDFKLLATFGGMSLAVTAITNGLRRAFGWNPRYLGLVVALSSR